MGLFNNYFSGRRGPLSTGPGARLIPWFLPGHRSHPDQKQCKPSLSASSPSKQNSLTLYLSSPIADITGLLGYDCTILYSSLSSLSLYPAPFYSNPPTSLKNLITHVYPTGISRCCPRIIICHSLKNFCTRVQSKSSRKSMLKLNKYSPKYSSRTSTSLHNCILTKLKCSPSLEKQSKRKQCGIAGFFFKNRYILNRQTRPA